MRLCTKKTLFCLLFVVAALAFASHQSLAANPLTREGFLRTVEADIALAEAEAALQKHDIALARKLYRYACELVPEDGNVWYQAAHFELSQGRSAIALNDLNESLKRDPHLITVQYERALLLEQLGRDDEAEKAFADYAAKYPDDGRAAYYLGLHAFKQNHFDAAETWFDKARKGNDATAAYAQSYYALLLGRRIAPETYQTAQAALASAPTPQWRHKLELLSVRSVSPDSNKHQRYLPWLSGYGELTLEFDSNASLTPATIAQTASTGPVYKRIAAFRLIEDTELTFRPIARSYFTLELSGEFVNANHITNRNAHIQLGTTPATLAQLDYGGPTVTLNIVSRSNGKSKVEGGLNAVYRDLFLNNYRSHFLTALGGGLTLGGIFSERHFLYAFANIENRDFIANNPPDKAKDPYDRDGIAYTAGLLYQVPFWWFDAVANINYNNENTGYGSRQRGIEYRFQGGRGFFALRLHIKNIITLEGDAAVDVRYYNNAQPRRLEERQEYGANIRWNVIRHFAINAAYNYTRNDAYYYEGARHPASDPFTYRRHVGSLSLIGHF